MIHNVDPQLNQWDVGRSVKVSDSNATHVHFANQGDSKAVIIEIANGEAKIPDYLLQTGKTVFAYAVLNGVTLESRFFAVRKRERPENYVYEEDQRNYIYTLIANAEKATADAKEAADRANQAAKSWVLMGQVRGESVSIDDAIDQPFAGFRIFGKTTQDGIPTPDAPVELVSVENPTIMVNDQSAFIPYTLPGIPVTSGGNYTDANGQQWICDEIDFGRGVYVQRTKSGNLYEYIGNCTKLDNTQYSKDVLRFDFANAFDSKIHTKVLCNRFPFRFAHGIDIATNRAQEGVSSHSTSDSISLFIDNRRLASATLDGLKTYLQNNPTIVLCVINTPIETPLPTEVLAAYAAMHTSRGNTTVSNDAGAHMELTYAIDAKKYIDSKISGSILAATVE